MNFLKVVLVGITLLVATMLVHFFSYNFDEKKHDLQKIISLKAHLQPSLNFESKSHKEFIYEQ